MNEFVGVIATVTMGFKTRRCGGKTDCLTLVVDQEEMRRVAKDNTLECSRAYESQLLNPKIVDTTTTTEEKILTLEHRVTWY